MAPAISAYSTALAWASHAWAASPSPAARASAAVQLANCAEDTELLASIKGSPSFCEYYAGDFQRAVDFAREGLAIAKDGPQSVRLAINGEARALAKLGDV